MRFVLSLYGLMLFSWMIEWKWFTQPFHCVLKRYSGDMLKKTKSLGINMESEVRLLDFPIIKLENRSKRGKYPRLELWISNKNETKLPDYYGERITILKDLFRRFHFTFSQIERILEIFPNIINIHPYRSLVPKLKFLFNSTSPVPSTLIRSYLEQHPQLLGRDLVQCIALRHAFFLYFLSLRTDEDYNRHFFDLSIEERNLLREVSAEALAVDLERNTWNFFSFLPKDETEFLALLVVKGVPSRVFSEFKTLYLQGGLEAVRKNRSLLLKILLQQGYQPEYDSDRQNRSPLMWSVANPPSSQSSLAIVKLLDGYYHQLDPRDSHLNERSTNGDSLFHWAARGGNWAICQYLHQRGCSSDQSVINKDGIHPMHWAAGSGHLSLLRWFLEHKHLPLLLRNHFGCTVHHFAASGGTVRSCNIFWIDLARR